MTPRTHRRSPLAVQVLQLLDEEPMHAYSMQRLIAKRHKDRIVNIAQRNSIYQTLGRLLRGELIEVYRVEKDPGRPERTVYRVTESGRSTLDRWLRTMLSTPAQEFPEFPVAIAALPSLTPELAIDMLETRADALRAELARADEEAATAKHMDLPRLLFLEHEYLRTLTEAELEWVAGVLTDLRTGHLDWNREWLTTVNKRLSQT